MKGLNRVEGLPWALEERYFRAQVEGGESVDLAVLESHREATEARRGARQMPEGADSVAIIPITSAIEQRASLWEVYGLSVSTETIDAQLSGALNDPKVGHIVFDVDSPGGSVFGIEELGAKIRAARDVKPVTAVANSFMASAAYWLASQAGEVVVTPGGMVGSVGVIATHVDVSAAMAAEGVRVEFITAGKYKAEGNQFEPLSNEARDRMQAEVDAYYDRFIRTVAAGRGKSLTTVREHFGQGRMLLPLEAVEVGMVDRVASFDEVLGGIAANAVAHRRSRAQAQARGRAARAKVALAEL